MSQQLQKIRGVVSALVIHNAAEEFVRSTGQTAAGTGAAVGLALEGLSGAAAVAGLTATSTGDSVEWFTCKLGDQLVQGRFSKVTFKDGEILDMVVSPQRNAHRLVLAARRDKDHVLWLAPHCSRGVAAHLAFSWKLFGWLLVGLPSFFFAGPVIFSLFDKEPIDISFLQFMGGICFTMGVVAAPYFAIRFYNQWRPIAQQAEQIFATLDYPNPSHVDLPRDHKRYCKSKDIRWPYTVNNGVDEGPWTYHYLSPTNKAKDV